MKECWVRLGKFWERKGHSCEASRLQARPLASGPVPKACVLNSGLAPHALSGSQGGEAPGLTSPRETRCCCYLRLLGPLKAPMCWSCFHLGTSLQTQPTASWQPLTMSSSPRDGEDEFVMTSSPMPTSSASRCRRTARRPHVGL
jgi:hypothetical protein